jgi:hypothetical protein
MRIVSRLASPFAVAILAQGLMFLAGGCSGGETATGTVLKVDQEAEKKRGQMIEDYYKKNPPSKGESSRSRK